MSDANANTSLNIGDNLPAISLPMTGGSDFNCQDYQDQILVIYFYPKDSTPGCTIEGNDFNHHLDAFHAAGCQIFGFLAIQCVNMTILKAKNALILNLLVMRMRAFATYWT